MTRIVVGVDAGKRAHQAAAYDPARDRALGQLSVSVDRAGFERFRALLERLAPTPGAVLVGVEATGHYHLTLLEFLTGLGYDVVVINPYQAAQFRRSQGKKAKPDRLDARALARFVAVSAVRPTPPPDAALARLRELTRLRADLVRDRTTALNRLHGALDLAFPELLGVFRQPGSRTVLALLEAYPTAAAIAAADREALTGLLRGASQGQVRPARIEALVEAARTSVAARRAEAALAVKVRVLVRHVVALDRDIADVEAATEAGFAELGHAPRHFPVGRAVSLATILAEAGDVARYSSAKQFLAHFGWCPADVQSGQYKDAHPRLSKAGNPYVRRSIWLLAIVAVRHPGPYRDYFDRRTSAGKNKTDTLVAIGRKLLTTIYAILKTRQPYDPLYRHPGRAAEVAA